MTALMADAYEASEAVRWGLTPEVFRRACDAASAKGGPLPPYLTDFALAVACREGCEPAWDHVMSEYRPKLQRAAAALDPSGRADELADELFADLFSQSLFKYFHGRSSLSTWLRAVLAQRWVDRVRTGRRTDQLMNDERVPAITSVDGPDDSTCRAAVRHALSDAIDHLEPRDRLLLGCYYSQGMKLAAIGRVLREHEATVSRHLTRIREALRRAIEASLRTRTGYDDAAARECLRTVMTDAGDLDLGALLTPARITPEIVHTGRNRAAD
jgi:RNA polymerase sigma factor (sigma-70 family)